MYVTAVSVKLDAQVPGLNVHRFEVPEVTPKKDGRNEEREEAALGVTAGKVAEYFRLGPEVAAKIKAWLLTAPMAGDMLLLPQSLGNSVWTGDEIVLTFSDKKYKPAMTRIVVDEVRKVSYDISLVKIGSQRSRPAPPKKKGR